VGTCVFCDERTPTRVRANLQFVDMCKPCARTVLQVFVDDESGIWQTFEPYVPDGCSLTCDDVVEVSTFQAMKYGYVALAKARSVLQSTEDLTWLHVEALLEVLLFDEYLLLTGPLKLRQSVRRRRGRA